ncbi:hypothetical protein [Lacimonas salitolerans]|uniref:Uncharacterized protein n=1 Tax=Lacimonas salitolerans TaxID=1323750 RepID=A0ABW4EB62_9RHOB
MRISERGWTRFDLFLFQFNPGSPATRRGLHDLWSDAFFFAGPGIAGDGIARKLQKYIRGASISCVKKRRGAMFSEANSVLRRAFGCNTHPSLPVVGVWRKPLFAPDWSGFDPCPAPAFAR